MRCRRFFALKPHSLLPNTASPHQLSVTSTSIAEPSFPAFSRSAVEIDTRPLMAALAMRGATLCLPVVLNKTTIEFRELVRTAPLVDSGFGTVGPGEDATVLDPQILIVPLSRLRLSRGTHGLWSGLL